MEQFGYALSAYRACLGVYEVYAAMAYYQATQAEALKNYLDLISNHLESTKGIEGDLLALLKQANYAHDELQHKLSAPRVREGMDQFQENTHGCATALNQLLETSALHLQNCYTKFPNNPILWMLHDRSWHKLVKTIAQHLYANQYTYSTLYSSLHIKKEFIDLVQSEINTFVTIATEKTPALKIVVLKDALKCIAAIKIDIMAAMAENNIVLIEAPKISIFAKPDNFYERMFDKNKANQSLLEEKEYEPAEIYNQYIK